MELQTHREVKPTALTAPTKVSDGFRATPLPLAFAVLACVCFAFFSVFFVVLFLPLDSSLSVRPIPFAILGPFTLKRVRMRRVVVTHVFSMFTTRLRISHTIYVAINEKKKRVVFPLPIVARAMLFSLLFAIDLSAFRMSPVVDALDKARLRYTIFVQDLPLLALIEMFGKEDRIVSPDAPLLAGLRIDRASFVSQELIG